MSFGTSYKQWTLTILMDETEIKAVAYTVLQPCKTATFCCKRQFFVTCIISICAHLFMMDSVRDISCKAFDFWFRSMLKPTCATEVKCIFHLFRKLNFRMFIRFFIINELSKFEISFINRTDKLFDENIIVMHTWRYTLLRASQCMGHLNHQLSTDPKQYLLAPLTLAPASMSLFTTSQCPFKLAANNGLPPS